MINTQTTIYNAVNRLIYRTTVKYKWSKLINEQNTKIDGWIAMKSDSETEHRK